MKIGITPSIQQLTERLRELEMDATPGPWLTPKEEADADWSKRRKIIDDEGCEVWPWLHEGDRTLAYAARNALPRLLDEIQRLEAKADAWKAYAIQLAFGVIFSLIGYTLLILSS